MNASLKIVYILVSELKAAVYNPRKWSKEQLGQLMESLRRFGCADPIIVNGAPNRKNIVIGGHMRLKAAKELGLKELPVVYLNIPDEVKEKELNLRLNKNGGEFDLDLLKGFDEKILADIGFTSEDLDEIFSIDSTPEMFDLNKELEKLNIKNIKTKKGDVYEFSDGSRLMNGDSCIEADMLKLMDGVKADMCLTDPPYLLQYLKGKTRNKDGVTKGFGVKKNRIYLGTETLPDDFTDLWMANVSKVQKPDFSIIIFEHPKNGFFPF